MDLDVVVDPFDTDWGRVRDQALAAEERGWGAVCTWDHLSGAVHGQGRVLECWTLLSALAAVTRRVRLGPLVLNPANRDAGTVAQMASTLQELSGGRLLLGVGAGTGPTGAYAVEQRALGRVPAADPDRRAALVDYLEVLERVWSGTSGGVGGFLVPDPRPPVIVAAFGPKLAAVAGAQADGINTQAGLPGLEAVVGAARAAAPDPDRFLVTAFASLAPAWLDADSPERRRLAAVRCRRLMLVVPPALDPDDLPVLGNQP